MKKTKALQILPALLNHLLWGKPYAMQWGDSAQWRGSHRNNWGSQATVTVKLPALTELLWILSSGSAKPADDCSFYNWHQSHKGPHWGLHIQAFPVSLIHRIQDHKNSSFIPLNLALCNISCSEYMLIIQMIVFC